MVWRVGMVHAVVCVCLVMYSEVIIHACLAKRNLVRHAKGVYDTVVLITKQNPALLCVPRTVHQLTATWK